MDIFEAVRSNNLESVKEIIKRDGSSVLKSLNKLKQTPLHIASENENLEMCKLLLAEGANIDAQDINGKTPLYTSVEKDNYSLVNTPLSLCSTI